MKVAAAFLIVLCMLLSSSSGGSKGAKAKEVDLKTKLQQKIFHHHHHHHPHHHHYHHHHHHHPHHHHHHHHDALNKHHHHHHHHHNHHHHYHNPFKHHLHRHHSHKKHFHHHPHKHPLHQHHHSHKKHVQQHQDHVSHHHSNRKSDIIHAPAELPNKLKLHVQIKDSQATKRQSLPDLLANLGQHLMNLGSSITPKKSRMEVNSSSTGNPEIEGDVRNEVPAEPKSPTVDLSTRPAVEDSSSTSETIPTDSQRKNVSSLTEVEALLNSALDAASGDEMGSASSENDEAEASGAVTTNIVPKTNEVAQADRRNETFSEEPDIFGPADSREYNTSERQRESNYTLEEIAEKSFQTTESTDEKDEETNQSDVLKEDKSPVHGDQSKKVESETDVLTESTDTNTVQQHEKMHENSDQDKTSQPTSPTLSEELKSSDLNSTLDEGNIDKETIKSGLTSQSGLAGKAGLAESEEPVTEGSAAQDSTEEEVEKTEVSGSGEESSVETKDNTNGHNTAVADEKISQEESGARQESNKPNLDEEEDVTVQSIDQNEKESAEERQEKEDESKSFLKETAKQATLGESKPVQEENIDQQTVVNVAGNQIMGNQTDDGSFQPADSTEGSDPKKEGSVLEDKPVSNDPEKTVSVESLDQGATIKDAKLRGDLDTPVTQPIFNEPERSISVTNLVKGFQAQNEGTTSQLLDAAVKDLPSQRQTAINRIDYASGAGNFGQESIEGTPQGTQDEESQTDLEGFAEGPKTPAVLDELVEPSVSSVSSDPLVVNAEDSQVDDVHEDTSQEMGTEDAADEIPVFTLSTPIGDTESFATDESTLSPLTTPTSAVTSSSASFIDSGLNMSPRDSESPSLLEGYSTFTATAAPSQGLFSSLTQRAGLQRDMLDDPIEESLETAVDSKSS